MIEPTEAKRMFGQAMKGCPRIQTPDVVMAHCQFISELVAETTTKIRKVVPDFGVDDKEMESASLLHDIGYCFAKDPLLHPVIGGEFLHERGHPRLAQIMRGHTYAADAIRETGYKGLNPDEYEARTWNHALIDYASLNCGKPGERITPDEKFIRFRQKRDERFQRLIDAAEPRLRQEVKDIEALMGGDLSVLPKYGFV